MRLHTGRITRWWWGPERHSCALVVAVPLWILVLIYCRGDTVTAGLVTGYWDEAARAATAPLVFVSPIVAACAAWDLAPLRTQVPSSSTRLRLGVIVRWVSPALVLGTVALAIAWTSTLPNGHGRPHVGAIVILAVTAVLVVAAVAWGGLAALVLPQWLATPLALFVAYMWIIYPPAFSLMWLRHLSGIDPYPTTFPSQQIALPAAVAPVLPALGVIGALLVIASGAEDTGRRRPRARRGVALTMMALGVVVAAVMVAPYNQSLPTIARTDQTICRSEGGVTACVWPEHAHDLATIVHEAHSVHEALSGTDLPLEAIASESGHDGTTWVFGMTDSTVAAGLLRSSLVSGIIPVPVDQACTLDGDLAARYMASQAWLDRQAGVAAEELPSDAQEALGQLEEQSPGEQASTVTALWDTVATTCAAQN